MIKTVNKEYQKKDEQLKELKKQMLALMRFVNVKALTPTEQNIFFDLAEDVNNGWA